MSEWLTTGEMIDRLKVGEVAENENNLQVLMRDELVYASNHNPVYFSRKFIASKWMILPKYVTFEEAMKALKDGKMVCLLREDGQKMLSPFHKTTIIQRLDGIGRNFDSWFKGKWQIIEQG